MDNVAAARRLARPVAPSVGAMVAWYVVALGGPNAAMSLAPRLGLPRAAALIAASLLLLAGAVLCHRAYLRAKRELAADPTLRGRWFVENAWWILLVPFVLLALLLALVAFLVAGAMD